jgi:hypothetical protein
VGKAGGGSWTAVLPIRKWRESLRDLRRLEVEGAIIVVLWCSGGGGGDATMR